MAEIEELDVNVRAYRPKATKFLDVYKNDALMKLFFGFITKGYFVIGLFLILTTSDYETYKVGLFMLFTSLIVTPSIYLVIVNSKEKFNYESIEENTPKNEYMLLLGHQVKSHLGNAIKSLVNWNLLGVPLLYHAESVKRQMGVIGLPGSGKTVQLRGILEGQLILGGGALVIDAKGTLDEIKRFFALVYKWGRERDLFIWNFTNQDNTHTLNILNHGSALMILEILVGLINASEDKWKNVDKSFIRAVLKIATYKRDVEEEVLYIKKLQSYLTLTSLLRTAWAYRKKVKEDSRIEDFVQYLTTKIEIDYKEFISVPDSDTKFYEQCEKNALNADLQGVYEVGLACGNWEDILTTLGSDYGKIFNTAEPDCDLFEAVQNNKIILVSLPTMESDETSQMIGKLLLGIIKSVALQKIKNSFEPKIPFLLLLDEYGSIGVKGFGKFISKSRSIGLNVFLYFQTIAQLDELDEGKKIEKQAILDNISSWCMLKNQDDELAEKLSKRLPKVKIFEKGYKEKKEGIFFDDTKGGTYSGEIDYQIKEEDALKTEYMAKLNDGEMYLVRGDEHFKAVSVAPEDMKLTYEAKNPDSILPLNKVYPVKKLYKDFGGEIRSKVFANNLVYKQPYHERNKDEERAM